MTSNFSPRRLKTKSHTSPPSTRTTTLHSLLYHIIILQSQAPFLAYNLAITDLNTLDLAKMPIPTADLLDKESHNTHATDSADQTTESGNSSRGLGADAQQSSQNTEGDRTLSREEADRLYEERMEEEYAKREGGA